MRTDLRALRGIEQALKEGTEDRGLNIGPIVNVAYLLPPLCAALLDRNPEVRLRAALFIGRLQGDAESALGALRDALLDGDERVKKVADAAIVAIENSSPESPWDLVL